MSYVVEASPMEVRAWSTAPLPFLSPSTEWRPVSGHRYTTALPPRSAPRGGVRLRCALPRLATDLKPQEVWAAVHEGLVEGDEDLADGDLVVALRLIAPDGRRRNLAALVKPVVDGVLCGLHSYTGERLAEVVPRVEAASRSSQRVKEWLEAPGPLGGHNFVFPRGTGLQWSPADDRVARLEFELDQGDEAGLEGWVGWVGRAL